MRIDPVVLAVAFAVTLLLLAVALATMPRGERRRRRQPGTEVYCSCGARAEVGRDCVRCAWNRGRV